MSTDNRHPRLLHPVRESRSNSFLYRLVTSQRFLAIIGLGFLVAIILPLAKTYSQKQLVEKEISEVKAQIDDFENQSRQLEELLNYLQSEQSLEEQARQNLNLKKPGEAVVVIENKNAATTQAAASNPIFEDTNLSKWRRYFFN